MHRLQHCVANIRLVKRFPITVVGNHVVAPTQFQPDRDVPFRRQRVLVAPGFIFHSSR